MPTPNEILQLKKPTKGFSCPLSANTYGIEFASFYISDFCSKRKLFAIGEGLTPIGSIQHDDSVLSPDDVCRQIKYTFPEEVLRLRKISTSLTFKVGNEAVHNFRMIERHYFRDQLIKSVDKLFNFCIPASTNNWDVLYDVPQLDDALIEEMIQNPYETKSDSFYFVDNELIMHNKASYKYTSTDINNESKHIHYSSETNTMKEAKYSQEGEDHKTLTDRMDEAKISSPMRSAEAKYHDGETDFIRNWSKE